VLPYEPELDQQYLEVDACDAALTRHETHAYQTVAVEGTQYNNILLSTLVVEFMEELSGFFGSKLNYSTYGSGSVCIFCLNGTLTKSTRGSRLDCSRTPVL
jgi:hypothetical protein